MHVTCYLRAGFPWLHIAIISKERQIGVGKKVESWYYIRRVLRNSGFFSAVQDTDSEHRIVCCASGRTSLLLKGVRASHSTFLAHHVEPFAYLLTGPLPCCVSRMILPSLTNTVFTICKNSLLILT